MKLYHRYSEAGRMVCYGFATYSVGIKAIYTLATTQGKPNTLLFQLSIATAVHWLDFLVWVCFDARRLLRHGLGTLLRAPTFHI
jgi:hypothetical protein